MIRLEMAEGIDAFDVSTDSVRLATESAEADGLADRISYDVCDIDQIELEANVYEFAVAKMALHHFDNLEHIFNEIRKSLRPDGLFMFNEFIGPSRFQWTEAQLDLMNRLLQVLPRRNLAMLPARRIQRWSAKEMMAVDPSESVRSDEILPVLQDFFEIVELKPYGGTLLHGVLTHTMPTFDLDDDDQKSLLRMMFLFERTLIEQGVLTSDFAYVVARPLPKS